MPIYEYKCLQCEEEIEVMQKMSDAALAKCKSCGGELKKLITSTSFVLKGGGWYVTDYPSADRKKAMESKSKTATGTNKKDEKTTGSGKKAETAKKVVNE